MHKAHVVTLSLGLIVLTAIVEPALAEPDIRNIANSCAICHGTNGRSPGSIDSLAGLSANEFIEEMQEFKYEKGEGRIMGVIAQGYNDQQIRSLARYFQSMRAARE